MTPALLALLFAGPIVRAEMTPQPQNLQVLQSADLNDSQSMSWQPERGGGGHGGGGWDHGGGGWGHGGGGWGDGREWCRTPWGLRPCYWDVDGVLNVDVPAGAMPEQQ